MILKWESQKSETNSKQNKRKTKNIFLPLEQLHEQYDAHIF